MFYINPEPQFFGSCALFSILLKVQVRDGTQLNSELE